MKPRLRKSPFDYKGSPVWTCRSEDGLCAIAMTPWLAWHKWALYQGSMTKAQS